jgi:predicted AAA+ superfamily ATPase
MDLLEARTFTSLLKDPGQLEEMFVDPSQIIVIDEVQKLPSLLDEVHRLIQKKRVRFLLTGSSTRKQKHEVGNLLAGRAREADMDGTWASECVSDGNSGYEK